MSNVRATKSGFAAEAQKKIMNKYNQETAEEVMYWMKTVMAEDLNTAGDMESVFETLRDGTVLCRLANAIQPGSVKKFTNSTMAFKCMENINNFLEAAKTFGVPSQELFQTVDLWEKQNIWSVIVCLQSLGRKVGKYGKPTIGPKEAEKNVRDFSEETLKAGEGIINLQYGSNKGASQSGIIFGNTRHM